MRTTGIATTVVAMMMIITSKTTSNRTHVSESQGVDQMVNITYELTNKMAKQAQIWPQVLNEGVPLVVAVVAMAKVTIAVVSPSTGKLFGNLAVVMPFVNINVVKKSDNRSIDRMGLVSLHCVDLCPSSRHTGQKSSKLAHVTRTRCREQNIPNYKP